MTEATNDRRASRPPLRLAVGALEVVFEWAGDRWRHRMTCGGRTVAESVEDLGPDGDPRWPPSPALQEAAAGGAAGRPALLAVGSAGRTHFSASFAADPHHADTVLVEAACRVQEAAGWLGSTYRTPAGAIMRIPAPPASPPPCTLAWGYRVGPDGIVPAAQP